MGRMPRLVERGKKDRRLGEPSEMSWEEIQALELDPRVELIRQLIPLGLAEVSRMLEEEVEELAGRRHARKGDDESGYRHGHNPGSVRLGGQRHPVRVPRVRGRAGEVRLASYERLHGSAGEVDEGLFRTENAVVIRSFLRGLKDRGLDLSAGALVVIDGAKGLRSGVLAAFKDQVLIQRCQWHKRENVISHLPRAEQKNWRRRLQRAYQRPTYKEAAQALKTLKHELGEVNQSAVASLNEGFEETLTLHRLGVFPLVGRSLKTTNVLESVNAMAEQRCGRVDHWKTSSQKHRWFATVLLEIEPRLRRLLGYRHLPLLRAAIQKELGITLPESSSHAVA